MSMQPVNGSNAWDDVQRNIKRLEQKEKQAEPIADRIEFGGNAEAGIKKTELNGVASQESYKFEKPELFGIVKLPIEKGEVADRLAQGKPVVVEETRTIGGQRVDHLVKPKPDPLIPVDGVDRYSPQPLERDRVPTTLSSEDDLAAFTRVNTGGKPASDLESLAQKIASVTNRKAPGAKNEYYMVRDYTKDAYGNGVLGKALPDLEAAKQLKEGGQLAVQRKAIELTNSGGYGGHGGGYGGNIVGVPKQTTVIKNEADLNKFLKNS